MKRLRLNSTRPKDASQKGDQTLKPTSQLTEQLIEDFCDLLKRGLPADGVCDYLSITRTVFWKWRRDGERFNEDGGSIPEHALMGLFVLKMKRAMAEYRLLITDRLHHPTRPKTWVRDITILERRDRASFGRNDPKGGTDETFDADERFL